MTGFARTRREIEGGEVTLSIKSVNHKGLDLHFHLPPGLDHLENEIRGILKNGVARGHLQIHLALNRSTEGGGTPLNLPLLAAYVRAFREAAALYEVDAKPDLNSALRMPGMLSMGGDEELGSDVLQCVLETTAETLASLNEFREREGAATVRELRQRCENICGLVARMEEIRGGAVAAFHHRLRERLADLLRGTAIDPQRVAQEAALLADRSDISEELVRLRTHSSQLEAIISGGGEIGKRLDFLLQEMNRESNTILSKTGGLGDLGLTITELALAAKSEIDKIREQSLNLE